ncbi:hypothetical protein GQ600_11069 [Phytophthora cactorum]|nr:hypothetical protein GQ600_11069 [Phytophthora cactorum]
MLSTTKRRWELECSVRCELTGLAVLEVGSFIFIFLQSKCAFSPLYQLVFVLETQMCPVQVHLFVALIILLQYELFHLGADFSLQFEWLKDK